MSVYFVIPSKRPVAEAAACLRAWRERGYCTAIIRERADGHVYDAERLASIVLDTDRYQGWARSTNLLIATVMAEDSHAEWFVGGGDDYWPDPNKRAEEIVRECNDHFRNLNIERTGETIEAHPTWGVMQPTGDRWGEGKCTTCGGSGRTHGFMLRIPAGTDVTDLTPCCQDCQGSGRSAVIDRICGSPWMGREFCRRMYHGAGPLYNGYYHNFADEELQNVARKIGVLWQRRDLTQEHRHWARPGVVSQHGGDVRDMPEWARKINDPQQSDWERSKALFAKRKVAGFPAHEPLEL